MTSMRTIRWAVGSEVRPEWAPQRGLLKWQRRLCDLEIVCSCWDELCKRGGVNGSDDGMEQRGKG